MGERPIGQAPRDLFDHRGQGQPPVGVDRGLRYPAQIHQGLEFESMRRRFYLDHWGTGNPDLGHPAAILGEAVDRPVSRRGEVELQVARLGWNPQKGFKTTVSPKLMGSTASAPRRQEETVDLAFDRVPEFELLITQPGGLRLEAPDGGAHRGRMRVQEMGGHGSCPRFRAGAGGVGRR